MNTTHDREMKPASWPLLFTFRSHVFGQGYIAKIELSGRVLAELDVEGVWLYGVNPGAIAVGSATLAAANVDLHKALAAVFADFAEESSVFGEFRTKVKTFFDACDGDSVLEWERAVARMKAGATIDAPAGLPVKDAVKTRVYVEVVEQSTETVTAKDNPAAECRAADSQLAAAA